MGDFKLPTGGSERDIFGVFFAFVFVYLVSHAVETRLNTLIQFLSIVLSFLVFDNLFGTAIDRFFHRYENTKSVRAALLIAAPYTVLFILAIALIFYTS